MTDGGDSAANGHEDNSYTVMTTPMGYRVEFPSRYTGPLLQLIDDFAERFHIPLQDITQEIVDACLRAVMDDP